MPDQLRRILVAHADDRSRQAVVEGLRRVGGGPLSVSEAESLAAALDGAARLDPAIVFIDLTEEPELAFEVARGLRRPGRALVGLYNPLVMGESAAELFRRASRAGITDYVPLPASDAELEAVLEATDRGHDADPAEGRLVTFLSHKGGAGTTTLATSTALVLAASGLVEGPVTLCDADLRFGSAADYLGVAADRDLADLVRDLEQPHSFSTHLTVQPETGLAVLAAPRDPIEGESITPAELGRALIGLRRRSELVVVDAASGFDLMTIAALDLSERLVVVTEAVAPTVVQTRRFLDLLGRLGYRERTVVVVNRYHEFDGGLTAEVIAERLGRPADHFVPYDVEVAEGVHRGVPLVVSRQEGEYAEAVGDLARELAAGSRSSGASEP